MIGVGVASFGSGDWGERSARLAARLVGRWPGVPVVRSHHPGTLAESRNSVVRMLVDHGAEWVVLCDADDDLDPGYLTAMAAALGQAGPGNWLFQPATRGAHPDGTQDEEANVIAPRGRSLLNGNHMVIGTMFRADAFLAVGGFAEYSALEDWDLWLRLHATGARCVTVPDAVYWVTVRPDSRNARARTEPMLFRQITRYHRDWCRNRGLNPDTVHRLDYLGVS